MTISVIAPVMELFVSGNYISYIFLLLFAFGLLISLIFGRRKVK